MVALCSVRDAKRERRDGQPQVGAWEGQVVEDAGADVRDERAGEEQHQADRGGDADEPGAQQPEQQPGGAGRRGRADSGWVALNSPAESD